MVYVFIHPVVHLLTDENRVNTVETSGGRNVSPVIN